MLTCYKNDLSPILIKTYAINTISKINEIDASSIEAWISKAEPFIVRNFTPDIKNFGLTFIEDMYAAQDVDVLSKVEHSEKYGQVINHHERIHLKDYIAQIRSGRTGLYLERADIYSLFPGLQEMLPIQSLYKYGVESATNCWLGPKGTKINMHYDADDNFFVQAEGRKEVNLVSKDETDNVYMLSKSFYDGYTEVDTFNPDFEKYPKFKDVTIYNAEINPGDLLFIPKGWWHHIRSLEISVTYNIWWLSRRQFAFYLAHETLHRIRCLFGKAPAIEAKESYYDVLFSYFRK